MIAWIFLFLFEILAGVNAAFVFRIFERPIAGLIAGTVFTLVGVFAFWLILRRSHKFFILNLIVVSIYLFALTLPLYIKRVFTPLSQPLDDIIGIPINVFHRSSETLFLLLIFVTITQIFWLYKSQKSK